MKEVENDSPYSEEQMQLYRDEDLKIQQQARLEILSQKPKDLLMEVARTKETIEKVLRKDASLGKRVCTLFREPDIAIISILLFFL